MTELERGQLLTDEMYLDALEQYGDEFDARMGAEAVREMLMTIDLQREVLQVREDIDATRSETQDQAPVEAPEAAGVLHRVRQQA